MPTGGATEKAVKGDEGRDLRHGRVSLAPSTMHQSPLAAVAGACCRSRAVQVVGDSDGLYLRCCSYLRHGLQCLNKKN